MEGYSSGGPPPLDSTEFPSLPICAIPSISTSPPAHTSSQRLPSPAPITTSPKTAATHSQNSSLWKDLFHRAATTPGNYPPPSFTPDGTPVVKAPPMILLKTSEAWKDHILCHFFGDPPSLKKIFTDLNPIWGKNSPIQVCPYSPRSCLIFIPDPSKRKWVLDTGFWSAGTVAFAVSPWSPSISLSEQTLSSAPVWLSLRNVPPQLWSREGFELVASGVGDPLPPTTATKFPPFGVGSPKIRTVVALDKGPLPLSVIVEDAEGTQISIGIGYESLPPLCPSCNQYGHRSHRCPQRPRVPPATVAKPPPGSAALTRPSPVTKVSTHSAPDPGTSVIGTSDVAVPSAVVPPAADPPVQSVRSVQFEDLNPSSMVNQLGFVSVGPSPPSPKPILIAKPALLNPTPPQKPVSSSRPTSPLQHSSPRPVSPSGYRPSLPRSTSPSTHASSRPVSPIGYKPSIPRSISPIGSRSSLPKVSSPNGPDSRHEPTEPNSPPPSHHVITSPPVTARQSQLSSPEEQAQPQASTSISPSSSLHPVSPHRLPYTMPPIASFTSLLFRQIEDSHHQVNEAASESEELEDGELPQTASPDPASADDPPTVDKPLPLPPKKSKKQSKKAKQRKSKESTKHPFPFPLSKRLH